MAPSPEYDKEPKAPDKNASNISSEDSKVLNNLVGDQQNNPDFKPAITTNNSEVENNKHVSTLDDGQLRALLDEAITYKCPKDREGKSVLFKELLQEAEQDEQQECEAAARSLGRARHQLPHSNSLQDLMAALTAETAPRRHQRHHAAPPPSVSARAIHGGSLPSGVDTSSLLSEEPARGAGYLATVRCVNPPPLAERRVSASDANAPTDLDLNRGRSKPMFPVTYTARASLEIGSGSVGSGRAVTTTTASNQVPPPAARCPPLASPPAAPRPTDPPHWTLHTLDHWYDGLAAYSESKQIHPKTTKYQGPDDTNDVDNLDVLDTKTRLPNQDFEMTDLNTYPSIDPHNVATDTSIQLPHKKIEFDPFIKHIKLSQNKKLLSSKSDFDEYDTRYKRNYHSCAGRSLVVPSISHINPRNVRSMTIGNPVTIVTNTKNPAHTDKVQDNDTLENNIKVGNYNINDNSYPMTDDEDKALNKNADTDVETGGNKQDIELIDIPICRNADDNKSETFSQYCAEQQKLLQVLESSEKLNKISVMNSTIEKITIERNMRLDDKCFELMSIDENANDSKLDRYSKSEVLEVTEEAKLDDNAVSNSSEDIVLPLNNKDGRGVPDDEYIISELDKNANIFQTPSNCLLTPLNKEDDILPVQLHEMESNNIAEPSVPETSVTALSSHKSNNDVQLRSASTHYNSKKTISKHALRVLLLEHLFKSDNTMSSVTEKEVDSAIPFSCITTPEVVASCNTTPSAHAVALDVKPRSVISSSFNGLPLSRPNYGAAPPDDYKKSIDENGNSVQGFSSPLSGSSQHKKPRRKKSSKNETVIDCEKIDGYQGDKDVNELLRFIESNVEGGRGQKLSRAKHRDDCEDKGKKRRKDKEARLKRASSLEELSRTTLEELTAPRRRAEPPKAERRSWGDERSRPPEPPDPPDHLELTDFQTVTKRRKPRRREPEPGPPRAPRPLSDRSNDSNDDLDSVHSLPADAPPPPRPPPAPASYADIARTRHNIPDLIESCNFYGEGGGAAGGAPGPEYPALEARRRSRDKAARRPERPAPPDVLGERRPAVVLRSPPARLPDLDGVTFGFDVNEQLLGGRARCDLLPAPAPPPSPPSPRTVRYVPPPLPHAPQLAHLVHYVGSAWEEVVRCGGGKVRYFSE